MEDDNKNKEENQTNISTNKHNIIESESNQHSEEKTSDEFHNVNHQKIKLNEGKIKSELNKETKFDDDITTKNHNLIINETSYYDQINRYMKGRRKKVILIILLSINSIFLIISILDIVNSNKKIFNNKKLLIDNIVVFVFQILFIFSLISFQMFTLLSKNKNNFRINLVILLIICIITIVKILLYVKNKNKDNFVILNFAINFCLWIINLIILLITSRVIRMKKNEKQNIEEIINFTDIPQGTTKIKINDKKDNQIAFNISGVETKPEKKEGRISNLVEEENNKNDVDNTDEQK